MKKILFYAMTGEKSCLLHVLMNAVDLHEKGHEVKVVFEGRSVGMAPVLFEDNNPHFMKGKAACWPASAWHAPRCSMCWRPPRRWDCPC